MIQFDQIAYTYPGRKVAALADVTLALAPGERICIAGANGSGKSTLALLLAGLLAPTSGQIRLDGRLAPKVPLGTAGMAFQNPDDQLVASIVEKEIAFGLELRNAAQKDMEEALGDVLTRFGIESLSRRDVQTLSGGEKQKVAIGSHTVVQPRLLILDEPDSFLDAEGKAALTNALDQLRRRFPDLIEVRVAQDLSIMHEYQRLILLANGVVIADGPSSRLLQDERLLRSAGLTTPPDSGDDSIGSSSNEHRTDCRLVIEHLEFRYENARPILAGFNFTMNAGEIVALAGPTGSGKSTLGFLICGLLRPTGGRIACEATRRQAGPYATMALQQPERQFFLPTCGEEISFGPKNFGVTLSDSDVHRLLDMVGLTSGDFIDRDPLTLSVGEQRRLAFAVMLALDRSFIVFDEPTAGLDAAGIAFFEALVKRLSRRGTGVVVISHDLQLLSRLTERRVHLGR